jgi:hypothetical protein
MGVGEEGNETKRIGKKMNKKKTRLEGEEMERTRWIDRRERKRDGGGRKGERKTK